MRKWRNWQTHQLEGLTVARPWGFESPLPHHHQVITEDAVPTEYENLWGLQKMEVVWQNVPLFTKSQIFANYFLAQAFYLRHLKIFVPKVPKVTVVTPKSPKDPRTTVFNLSYIL